MNELVIMLPEDVGLEREVCMFLAEDDSLVDLDEDPAVRDKVFGALGKLASALVGSLRRDCPGTTVYPRRLLLSPLVRGRQESKQPAEA